MQRNQEPRNNLIKLFSLPFHFTQDGNKRYLQTNPEKTCAENQQLVSQWSADAMKLLVAFKKDELKKQGKTWNCSVLLFSELSALLNNLLDLPLKPGEIYRHQVILICRIFTGEHYTNLDIEIKSSDKGNRISIAAFDAAKAMTFVQAVIPTLKDLKSNYHFVDSIFYTDEAIQNDSKTCSIFAFDIAKQLAKQPKLYDLLREIADPQGKVLWSDLPVSFLKKAQSTTFIESINQKGPCNAKGESALSYLHRHSGLFTGSPSKMCNLAIIDFYQKYSTKIMPMIESMSDSELNEVITDKKTFSTALLRN